MPQLVFIFFKRFQRNSSLDDNVRNHRGLIIFEQDQSIPVFKGECGCPELVNDDVQKLGVVPLRQDLDEIPNLQFWMSIDIFGKIRDLVARSLRPETWTGYPIDVFFLVHFIFFLVLFVHFIFPPDMTRTDA